MELPDPPWRSARRKPSKQPLSQERIVETALAILDKEGLDAVSMRRVAQALNTGPASLYAHVSNKDELYELLLDRVLSEVELPDPDPSRWREQLKDVLKRQVRAMTSHQGIAKLALATIVPSSPHTLVHAEVILGLLRAGGLPDAVVAVAFDVLSLYSTAFAVEASAFASGDWDDGRLRQRSAQLTQYVEQLPERFPNMLAMGELLGASDPEQRFDQALDVILAGLTPFAGR
jgi:AcrR family transcriptional regulator